jgi:hypothetical protein
VFVGFRDSGVDAAFPARFRIEVNPMYRPDSSPLPGGTLTLSEGGRVLAKVPVENNWAFVSLAFAAGTHVVTASYSGDSNYLPTSKTANITAAPYTYDAAFSAYAGTSCPPPGVCNTTYFGQPVTFWFAVMLTRFPPNADMGAGGEIPPTGTVTFFDGRTPVASVALHGSRPPTPPRR